MQRLPNSIGYVEYAYAKQNKMTLHAAEEQGRQLRRRRTTTNFKAAAAGADWSKTFFQVLTDQAGKDAWPISGATFILMHKAQDKPVSAANALKFFDWAYANGDKMADDLDYVPLPACGEGPGAQVVGANIKDASGKADRLASERTATVASPPRPCSEPWPLHCPPRRTTVRRR